MKKLVVASRGDLLEFWTAVLRGDIPGTTDADFARHDLTPPKFDIGMRLSASNYLAKAKGLFTQKITITDDAKLKLTSSLHREILERRKMLEEPTPPVADEDFMK